MRLLRVSSKDRAVDSASKYKINFSTNDTDLHQVRQIKLKSAIIPNTMYNINQYNNIFRYKIAGVFGTDVVLTIGQYTLTDLMDSLAAQILADTTIVVGIAENQRTRKLSFTTATDIEFLSKAQGNPLGDVLGIYTGSGADTALFFADGLPNLMGLRHVYIGSNAMSNNTSMITNDKQKINIFSDIPIDVPFGGLQTYVGDTSTLHYVDFASKKNISSIDITLVDENQNILELNGQDFVLVFAVY